MSKPSILGFQKTPAETAMQIVRNYCGWHIGPPVRETLTLDGNGQNKMALPSNRVSHVHALAFDGVPVTDFRVSSNGWLKLPKGQVFPDEPGSVTVTLTHGHEDLEVVAKVINSLAARAQMGAGGIIASQRAGTQSVAYGMRGGEATGVTLLQQEKEELAPYKLWWLP